MTKYAVYSNPKAELKTKDRADLLEAFLGALYVDKDLEYCETFCHVCLFPRLQDFIMNQDWNDPKSKLQQCCLTLRTMDGNEPDIPYYKVVESTGPTNTRVYKVAVYFREKRLASSTGHSIQQAEMNAAKKALENSKNLFPQLDHQKRVIAKSLKRQKVKRKLREGSTEQQDNDNSCSSRENLRVSEGEESRLPKQYQKRAQGISDASDISSESSLGFETDSSMDSEPEKILKWTSNEMEEDNDSLKSLEVAPIAPAVLMPVDLITEAISSPEYNDEPTKLEDLLSELSDNELDAFD
jgi:ribonuclease-3